MILVAHLLALAVFLAPASPSDVELCVRAVLLQVPPAVALAVREAETGDLPPGLRDRVVSRGNVGRFQVNLTTWRKALGYRSRKAAQAALQAPRENLRAGLGVLALVRARRALPDASLALCSCGTPHLGGWWSHYNGGTLVQAGSRAESYGLRVQSKIDRWSRSSSETFSRRW